MLEVDNVNHPFKLHQCKWHKVTILAKKNYKLNKLNSTNPRNGCSDPESDRSRAHGIYKFAPSDEPLDQPMTH